MTAILDVLLAIGVGLVLDYELRRLLIRRVERLTAERLRLLGHTEVYVTIYPLPHLVECWQLWRFCRGLLHHERRRLELIEQIEAAHVQGISCGFVTPNEARDRWAA